MALFTQAEKWYLVSPEATGDWASVVTGWNASNVTFYNLIYKLKAGISHNQALTTNDWESVDITDTVNNTSYSSNLGYWVYVESITSGGGGGTTPIADNSLIIDKTNKSIRLKKSDKTGFSFKSIQLNNTPLVTATTNYVGSGAGSGSLELVSGTGSSGTDFVANPGTYQAGLGVPYIKAQSITPTAPSTMAKLSGDDTLFTFNLSGLDTSSWDDTYKPSDYTITLYNTSEVEETITSGLTIVVV